MLYNIAYIAYIKLLYILITLSRSYAIIINSGSLKNSLMLYLLYRALEN
jgi:hypothetical protein